MRRRLGPDARRSELLEAALGVLRRLGPHGARVEDVTRAAGAAKGTFYLYFASWNDLLVAVRDHLVSTYAADVRARLAAAPAMRWAAIESECVRLVEYVVGLGDLHEAIFHGTIADQPISPGSSADTLIAEMLKAGIAAGACRPVAADFAAPLLFSVLHATADGIARSGGRKRRLETLLELLRAWLRA
jgi:AcrR family transcriptional regulator